ncbi:MAG: glycoside hydrolase family 28 protein [Acholeplasmatales bacterium]|nr:glycoside hydrolase family 28 protein [Acholeplasmatales bacterium]
MKILSLTSRTITLELQNSNPYYYVCEYDVYLNNEFILKNNKNIITIYNLTPCTMYEISILDFKLNFKTKEESACLNVKDFHAIGDGISDDTVKIQAAIMCCPKNGTVYIPKGIYLVSSLFLKSDMMLYLDKDAKLLAKTNRLDYPIFPGLVDGYNFGVWEGSEVNNFSSIINGINVNNVVVAGEGEIDSQAEAGDWYINHRVMNIAWRGHAIFFNRSSDISIIGIYVHNTQSWAIHPYFTNNIEFINVRITNEKSMPTTDGIDPDCCDNVKIMGCYFNVGDDCIAIKSGTIDLAKKYRKPCNNLYISNNLMASGHGGVVFGSESSGGITNVVVNKCIFKGTDRGLRIKTRRGRGNIGTIDNVSFENILMDNVKTPFVINMYYNMGPKGGHEEYVWTTKKLPVDENTPVLGSFKFNNMKCIDVEYAAGVFLGLPEMPIKSIELNNISFDYKNDAEEGYPVMIEHNFKMCKKGIYAFNVDKIIMNNVDFNGNSGKILEEERSVE